MKYTLPPHLSNGNARPTDYTRDGHIPPFQAVRGHIRHLTQNDIPAIKARHRHQHIDICDRAELALWGVVKWMHDEAGRQRLERVNGEETEPATWSITGTIIPHVTNMTDTGTLVTPHMIGNMVPATSTQIPKLFMSDAPTQTDRHGSTVRNHKTNKSIPTIQPGSAVYSIGVKPTTAEFFANAKRGDEYASTLVDKTIFPQGTPARTLVKTSWPGIGKASSFITDDMFQLNSPVYAPRAIAKLCNELDQATDLPAWATAFVEPLIESPLVIDDPAVGAAGKMARLNWPATVAMCEENGDLHPTAIDTHSLNQAPAETVVTVIFQMELSHWPDRNAANSEVWKIDWVPVRIYVEGIMNAVPQTTTLYADNVVATPASTPRKRKRITFDHELTPKLKFDNAVEPRKVSGSSSTNVLLPDPTPQPEVEDTEAEGMEVDGELEEEEEEEEEKPVKQTKGKGKKVGKK